MAADADGNSVLGSETLEGCCTVSQNLGLIVGGNNEWIRGCERPSVTQSHPCFAPQIVIAYGTIDRHAASEASSEEHATS